MMGIPQQLSLSLSLCLSLCLLIDSYGMYSEWGGEVEIRAMGEIYCRPIEIYVYSVSTLLVLLACTVFCYLSS
jgi:hypothetical protein